VGPGTSLFGYDNQVEDMRLTFEALRKAPKSKAASGTDVGSLTALLGMASPELDLGSWLDFSLLPAFDKVSKYFTFSVYAGTATADGLSYMMFSPVPPTLKSAGSAK